MENFNWNWVDKFTKIDQFCFKNEFQDTKKKTLQKFGKKIKECVGKPGFNESSFDDTIIKVIGK